MSHTFKDATKKQRFLEVVRKGDGTYDLFLDDAPDRSSIPTQWLQEELCVRFGFCGEEYESILREVNLTDEIAAIFVGSRSYNSYFSGNPVNQASRMLAIRYNVPCHVVYGSSIRRNFRCARRCCLYPYRVCRDKAK